MSFNRGKAYHGSDAVAGGKLTGRTGQSDYFFFLCPVCKDSQVMRILEHEFRKAAPPVQRDEKIRPTEHFNLAFHLYCPSCQFKDFIKIDNNHQAGPLNSK
jgi:hypothetical protein